MSKHTPGPWKSIALQGAITVQSNEGAIATLYPFNNEQHSANARLIAAAPELLETLKSAVENCGCSLKERLSGHLTACPAPEWEAVIAKAEGRDE